MLYLPTQASKIEYAEFFFEKSHLKSDISKGSSDTYVKEMVDQLLILQMISIKTANTKCTLPVNKQGAISARSVWDVQVELDTLTERPLSRTAPGD